VKPKKASLLKQQKMAKVSEDEVSAVIEIEVLNNEIYSCTTIHASLTFLTHWCSSLVSNDLTNPFVQEYETCVDWRSTETISRPDVQNGTQPRRAGRSSRAAGRREEVVEELQLRPGWKGQGREGDCEVKRGGANAARARVNVRLLTRKGRACQDDAGDVFGPR